MTHWIFDEDQLEHALAAWVHGRVPKLSAAKADAAIDLILEFLQSEPMHMARTIQEEGAGGMLQ